MTKQKAVAALEKISAAFAGETDKAAHLVRIKLQAALEHAQENWEGETPEPASPVAPSDEATNA